jgi:Na+/H+-dicarboxylate symporter
MVIKGKKISLTTQIFIAMLIGAVVGIAAPGVMISLGFLGDIWLNCIKMIVVPMILCTIVTGIITQDSAGAMKRISVRIIFYYITTTVLACIIGLSVSALIQPGHLANFIGMASEKITEAKPMDFASFAKGLFSTNMFKTFTDGNIIQTLIIAILVGIAILKMKDGEQKETIKKICISTNSMVFSLIGMIMAVSPVGVFFLMGSSFGKYGLGIFTSMAYLLGTYYLACLIQVILIYGTTLIIFARINPFTFIKDSAELWLYTISTCSSIASIPVNIKVAKEKFGIPEKISGFTIPLGTQMNTDGSVLLYGCVIMFISQMVGQDLTLAELIKTVFIVTIMSMGGGGIPGSGIVKLMVVVQAVGLSIEIVGVIAAFYHLFDMGTTTNNCLGDLAGTVVVGKCEERYTVHHPV